MVSRVAIAAVGLCTFAVLIGGGCGGSKAPAGPPTSIRIQAAGADTGKVLSDAVAKIADGGTITLAAGSYELKQLLTINKSVQLVAAGMTQTRIISTVKDKGILFSGNHHFSATGITFSHEGAVPGGVVWVDAGEVNFSACRFTGAASNRSNYFYEALWIRGTATGVIENCVADESDIGIGIAGTATPVIQDCTCKSNSEAGIAVYGSGHPSLRHDRCSGNSQCGIELNDQARAVVLSDQCSSERFGIYARDRSAGSISDCICNANSADGINLGGRGRFAVNSNTCRSNAADGISVVLNASVTLTDNECLGNKGVGIGFWGAARGTASDNTCSANGRGTSGGLCVGGRAIVTVSGNTCSDNANYGILFRDHARGTARDNMCEGNKYGIIINSPASATLIGNSLGSNSVKAVGRW